MQADVEVERESVCLCVTGYVQALPVAINEGLEQRFVVGDGLQYIAFTGHITNGPLTQPGTTQPEDVTVRQKKRFLHKKKHNKQAANFKYDVKATQVHKTSHKKVVLTSIN